MDDIYIEYMLAEKLDRLKYSQYLNFQIKIF